MKFNTSLRNCGLILSYPVAESFKPFIILLISVSITGDRKCLFHDFPHSAQMIIISFWYAFAKIKPYVGEKHH